MVEDTAPGDADDCGPLDVEPAEARLEAALDRIARRLDVPRSSARPGNTAELAARLDGLIARVRETLDRGPGD